MKSHPLLPLAACVALVAALALTGSASVPGGLPGDLPSNAREIGIEIDPSEDDPLYTEVAKLTLEPPGGDDFGHTLSMDGNLVLIGTTGIHGNNGETAYLFERQHGRLDDWRIVAAFPPVPSDFFGLGLGLSGDVAVVQGGIPDSEQTGVWVFQRDYGGPGEWGLVTILEEPEPVGDTWGIGNPSVSGDTIVAGSPQDDTMANSAGAAYVFQRSPSEPTTWIAVSKLVASDGTAYDLFGNATAVDDGIVVVGADGYSIGNDGAAYVFEQVAGGRWTEVAKLIGGAEDEFGQSVAIHNDTIAVGASGPPDLYIFERDAGGSGMWGQVAELTSSDGGSGLFDTVDIDGDNAVLGAEYARNDDGLSIGAAYVFHRDADGSWSEIAKLTASDGMEFDTFGQGVAISGRFVIAGADKVDPGGAAYVFAESECVLEASIGNDRDVSPGEILQVELYLQHNRLATVTVPFILWVEDSDGNVVTSRVTAPHTFHHGDEVNVTVEFPLPQDLAPGEYRFLLGIDNMNPPQAWAEERFQVRP